MRASKALSAEVPFIRTIICCPTIFASDAVGAAAMPALRSPASRPAGHSSATMARKGASRIRSTLGGAPLRDWPRPCPACPREQVRDLSVAAQLQRPLAGLDAVALAVGARECVRVGRPGRHRLGLQPGRLL